MLKILLDRYCHLCKQLGQHTRLLGRLFLGIPVRRYRLETLDCRIQYFLGHLEILESLDLPENLGHQPRCFLGLPENPDRLRCLGYLVLR